MAGLAVLLAMALGGAACGDRLPDSYAVADSAGVAVVTNAAGSVEAAEVWAVASVPAVEIGGGAEPDVPLYRVSAVSPLESGRVAVGMTVPPQVLVFEISGALSATLGRQGEGPGEFAMVSSVVPIAPDSVGVWDPDRRRFLVFTEEGDFQREVDLSATAPLSARASSNAQTVSGLTHLLPSVPGSVILFGEALFGPGADQVIRRHEMPASRITTDGETLASLGSFPGMQTSPGLATPFGARTHAGSSNDIFAVGTAEVTEYRLYSPSGDLVRIVRWPDHDRSVGGPFLNDWMEMGNAEPGLGSFIQAAPRAEHFPAYDDLLVSAAGEVLVAGYPGPLGLMPLRRADQVPEAFKPKRRMSARSWLVFDSRGALVGTLVTPEGFEPYAMEGTMLWGVYTDELDVESVRAYDVERP